MIPALIIAAVLIVAYCILYSMLNASGAADDRAFDPNQETEPGSTTAQSQQLP